MTCSFCCGQEEYLLSPKNIIVHAEQWNVEDEKVVAGKYAASDEAKVENGEWLARSAVAKPPSINLEDLEKSAAIKPKVPNKNRILEEVGLGSKLDEATSFRSESISTSNEEDASFDSNMSLSLLKTGPSIKTRKKARPAVDIWGLYPKLALQVSLKRPRKVGIMALNRSQLMIVN
ncbi:hypothetical protein GH714_022707 [Hevea brasiliensis]|uniref:Uncharacterized protein n=1 Tax=Hevea brasiliensis TaxID=3981 RepID=A0A6A6LIR7_HEVBR|nr:hypothetical protein GH714_022707 [Hevea brasiliensis]